LLPLPATVHTSSARPIRKKPKALQQNALLRAPSTNKLALVINLARGLAITPLRWPPLASDPFEQKNLSTTNPVELKRMMQELITRMETQKAQYPHEKDSNELVKPKLPK
jgi:hypothetical protein